LDSARRNDFDHAKQEKNTTPQPNKKPRKKNKQSEPRSGELEARNRQRKGSAAYARKQKRGGENLAALRIKHF